VASFVLGLLAILTICGAAGLAAVGLGIALAMLVSAVITVGLSIAAVVTGIVARRRIRTGAATGNGLAITGLVLGIVTIALILALVVVVVVAVILDS
jgi:hypothetical protein